jgi:hypothetical protein
MMISLNLNSPLLVGVKRKSRFSGQHEMNSNKVLDPEDKPSGVS